jgi:predicted AlkP superfamily phosphohydrolase/phosphomutase
LIGVDGADWKVVDRLIEEGLMPNVARMKAEGAYGPLASLEPIFSPIVWASIATGKVPEKHGIRSFTVTVDDRAIPVTSNLFRAERLWEILGDRGHTVGVAGWWTSWPAIPVNGFLCSDRLWPVRFGKTGMPITSDSVRAMPHRTFPEDLAASLEPLIVERHDLTEEDLRTLDVTGPLGTVHRDGPCVADVYAKDLTFLRIGRDLIERTRPDFFSVYFELPDVMAHYFWDSWRFSRFHRFQEPTEYRTPPKGMAAEVADYVGQNFERGYAFIDEAVGAFLSAATESTLVLVVSDHGYGENEERKRLHIGDRLYASNPHWHQSEGILLAWGYGVRQGPCAGATVLDITPTILYAMGEPLGRDMDGTVLTTLFSDAFAARAPAFVDTHEPPDRPAGERPIASVRDEEYREMLRSLGYIQ